MSGIVKYDEDADQEACGRQGQEQAERVGDLRDRAHGEDPGDVRDDRSRKLADAPRHRRLPVLTERALQCAGFIPGSDQLVIHGPLPSLTARAGF